MKRAIAFSLLLMSAASIGAAQEIQTPPPETGSYDPTLSAKEALMANWELAVSGIRAGAIVAEDVLQKTDASTEIEDLRHRADFTLNLMIKRYGAAHWAIATQEFVLPIDRSVMSDLAQAVSDACEAPCAAQKEVLRESLQAASVEMRRAHQIAKDAVLVRKDVPDNTLMIEQLSAMARYLESGAWQQDLALDAYGRGGEEIQSRLVGTMVLWRNIEPYVGMISPKIDDAINAAAEQMLRDMRRIARSQKRLDLSTVEFVKLSAAARQLALELRRASLLFAS